MRREEVSVEAGFGEHFRRYLCGSGEDKNGEVRGWIGMEDDLEIQRTEEDLGRGQEAHWARTGSGRRVASRLAKVNAEADTE